MTAALADRNYRNYYEFRDAVIAQLERAHPTATQEPQLDHGLADSWGMQKAIEERRPLSDAEWEQEFARIDAERESTNAERTEQNRARQAMDPPKPPLRLLEPLSPQEKQALRHLGEFLREEPLRIGNSPG